MRQELYGKHLCLFLAELRSMECICLMVYSCPVELCFFVRRLTDLGSITYSFLNILCRQLYYEECEKLQRKTRKQSEV